jgi:fructoselysine-6-P-deglycase FrlB-like protein
MSEIEREVTTQPACWHEAVALASSVADVLPASGARVVSIGCGTSLYMAEAYAGLRERLLGAGETDAFPASEAPVDRTYDVALVISRSGTTTEVLRFLAGWAGDSVAIVGDERTPVAGAARRVVPLPFADERSVVQTRFATTTLALLRAQLGEDLTASIADGERATADPLPIEPERFDRFVFLGKGWTVGLANEAALKLREACQAWTESYPAMEYRHGPISLAGPTTAVWSLGDVDGSVLDDAEAAGAVVVRGARDPMAELIMIQRTAIALARAKGLDPDRPPHLTRSVVIP